MRTKRAFKAAIALTVVAAVAGIGAQSASAVSGSITSNTPPVNVTFVGGRTVGAALITLTAGSAALQAYCIDLNTHTGNGVTYDEGTWSQANVPDVAKVTAILQASYPVLTVAQLQTSSGITTLNEQEAIAGTQAAIWHFTDLINLDRTVVLQNATSNIGRLYDYLLRIASNPATEPVPALSITPSNISATVATAVGPFTLHVTPASATATVTNDPGVAFTDVNGNPVSPPTTDGQTFWVTPTAEGSFHINATAQVAVPTGRVFLHTATTAADAHQKLVLATSSAATTTATASFQSTTAATTTTVAETTTTVAETTTTAAPTTTDTAIVAVLPPVPPSTFAPPTASGVVTLPATGRSTVPGLLIATGTLLLGIAITAMTRRRVAH